ncbi:MAG TPA: glycosyltransferase [Flavisolibacter sp.]|nr:glycosyltransferase [Flavisolibacter sp.]
MIPVYNCYQTLGETLASVLGQDRGKDQMQIEVSDDGSTDSNVKELVEPIGKGRIGYFRLELSNYLSFSVQDNGTRDFFWSMARRY